MARHPRHQLGNKPIEKKFEKAMNNLAAFVDDYLNGDRDPRKTGFVLLVFPFDDGPGRCNYISNAEREDVIVLLKEQLNHFEGGVEDEGHG